MAAESVHGLAERYRVYNMISGTWCKTVSGIISDDLPLSIVGANESSSTDKYV
jgi:hypothetical protein